MRIKSRPFRQSVAENLRTSMLIPAKGGQRRGNLSSFTLDLRAIVAHSVARLYRSTSTAKMEGKR